jgi:hypothetical protein
VHRAYRELGGGAWDDAGDVAEIMREVNEMRLTMTGDEPGT